MSFFIKTFWFLFKIFPLILSIALVSGLVFIYQQDDEIVWIDSNIEEISSKSKYIAINKIKESAFQIEGKTCNTYILDAKQSSKLLTQPFVKKAYTRNQEEYLLSDKPKLDSLCQIFNDMNRGIPTSRLVEQFSKENPLHASLSIILEITDRLNKSISEVHLYVKGYADKTKSEWHEPLEVNNHYSRINFYTSLNKTKNQFLISQNGVSTHIIESKQYSNNDYPT